MKQKILFVDNDINIQKPLKRAMDMAGVNAEYAGALAYISRQKMDIIVADPENPGIDGITFSEEVQRLYPDIYRGMLSCFNTDDLKIKQALTAGMVEQQIDKSWDLNELLAYFERYKDYAPHSFI